MPLTIDDIEIHRDGGSITFNVRGDTLTGLYRLRTPLHGEPRLLYRDERELAVGGQDERDILAGLEAWLGVQLTADTHRALSRLDSLRVWRNLPDTLSNAVPLHHIRTVIRCLEARAVFGRHRGGAGWRR